MSRLTPAIGTFFLLLATVLFAGAAVEHQIGAVPPPASTTAPHASATTTAEQSPASLPPIPSGYRIQIPRLGIDLPILEGDVERDVVQLRTPENFAFHLPGTGIPGAGLNSYIYAHARRGMFLTLWNARVGDEVWISTPAGRALRYVVSEVHARVPRDEVQWAAPSAPDRLTLQTSTGPNQDDPRFIVVAQPG